MQKSCFEKRQKGHLEFFFLVKTFPSTKKFKGFSLILKRIKELRRKKCEKILLNEGFGVAFLMLHFGQARRYRKMNMIKILKKKNTS